MTDDVAELAGGLRTVVNRLAYAFRKSAAKQQVTPTRLTALVILEKHGPLRPGDLAGRLSISAASMSRLTEVLEEGEWIERQADPGDGRACLLALTEPGRGRLLEFRTESLGELASGIRELSDAERGVLSAALPVLTKLADEQLAR